MHMGRKIGSLILALALAASSVTGALAAASPAQGAYDRAAAFVTKAVPAPEVSSIGGEWAVIGLTRGGATRPQGYDGGYLSRVEQTVKEKAGVLHSRKYTEYSRVILALSALNQDARDVGGYDLTLPLGDFDKTVWQGINGPIWALIALDSRNYPMPQNPQAKTQATRQMYVDRILSRQLSDGSWSLSGEGSGDVDVTAMALQALSRYTDQAAVKTGVDRALSWLSGQQQADGGFATGGAANAESCAQVVVALESLGLPLTDSRFVKNWATVLNALLGYQLTDGSFCHVKDGGSNLMATEQSLYALAAVKRAEQGESGLYVMEGLETASRNTSEVGTLNVGWSARTIAAVALTAAFASPK